LSFIARQMSLVDSRCRRACHIDNTPNKATPPGRNILTNARRTAALAAALLASAAFPAFAQDAPPAPMPSSAPSGDAPPPQAAPPATVTGRQVYTPDDFARFSPKNALDMLTNIPGFTIRSGDDGRRGLGQATENVLVNGARLASKSDGLTEQLARIPAGDVIRIEIVDGATLNIPGLSGQVANIVAKTGALSGQFTYRPEFRAHYSHPQFLGGEVSLKGTTGPVEYTLALSNDSNRGAFGGPYNILDGNGAIIEQRKGRLWSDSDNPKVSAGFKLDGPGSSVGNLNLSYRRIFGDYEEDETRVPVSAVTRQRILRGHERGYDYEIGGDYEFALGPGRLKLIGLDRYSRDRFSESAIFNFADNSDSVGGKYAQDVGSGEVIGRGEYSWKAGKADWQIAFEAAFNRLDKVANLFDLDPSGTFVDVPFPEGTGGVREDRYEGFVSYGRPLSPKLTMQLSLGGEYSQISQTGANALSRTFFRPKGTLNLAWAAAKGLDVSLKVERAVGQLDFNDFLARVFLDQGNQNADNAQLVPPQSWNIDLEAKKDLGAWGTTDLRLFERTTQDYIDIVPLPGGVEGRGNISRVERHGFEWTSTIKLEPLGIPGAKIDTDVVLQRSRLKDPLTGIPRELSYLGNRLVDIAFRHDIPHSDWAYGGDFEYLHVTDYYRLGEFGHDFEGPIFAGVFVENKDVFGLTVNFKVVNVTNGRHYLRRTVYEDFRNNSPIAFVEDRDQLIGPIFRLTVKGSF
jgi:hypothetical protein